MVVHLVTKETITSYTKLVDDPLLYNVRSKAVCKELGRLAQRYGETKDANTIKLQSSQNTSNFRRPHGDMRTNSG